MAFSNPETKSNFVKDAVDMAYGHGYSQARAVQWLALREGIDDPQHELNKTPILTLLVLNCWLDAPDENNVWHPDAQRWLNQVVHACLAWQWPQNSTSTTLYYRLGHLLSGAPERLDFLASWRKDDPAVQSLLARCKHLEDDVRPTLSAAIAYQLQGQGVRLVEPQDVLLNRACDVFMDGSAPSGWREHMELLWITDQAQTNYDAARRLVQHAPETLPGAISRALFRTKHKFSDQPFDAFPPTAGVVLGMDPSQSDTNTLLDTLSAVYQTATNPRRPERAVALWETLGQAIPRLTGVLETVVAMEGMEALDPRSEHRAALCAYIRNAQDRTPPWAIGLDGLFEVAKPDGP